MDVWGFFLLVGAEFVEGGLARVRVVGPCGGRGYTLDGIGSLFDS